MDTLITNTTKDKILHDNPSWALNTWQQATGFMFSAPGTRAIIFLFMPPRKIVLHMWFVFGSIDVLVLDGAGKVIALKERFRPWSAWNALVSGSAVLELPVGTIERTGTEIGDHIALPHPPIK